ncbi:hypothetical protein AB1484_07255 [Parafrankia sp. FMc6]|uniref:hypothetical protein n=1 Tax=Parafrankia soli TaxID=2599596 RepID=UPI0034D61F2E
MRDLRDLAAFSGLVVVCGALAGTPRGGLCVAPNGRYDAITIHEFYEIENGAASTELLSTRAVHGCRPSGVFAVTGVGRMPPHGMLDGLPSEAVERALWWERHVVEVLDGRPLDSTPGAAPRPEFDPGRWSLTRREQAKAAELAAASHRVSAATVSATRHGASSVWSTTASTARPRPSVGSTNGLSRR